MYGTTSEERARGRVERWHAACHEELVRALGQRVRQEDAEDLAAVSAHQAAEYWKREVADGRRTWESIGEGDCRGVAKTILRRRLADLVEGGPDDLPGDEPILDDALVAEDDVFAQVATRLDEQALLDLIALEPAKRQWPLQRIAVLGDTRAEVARDLGVDRATVGRWMQALAARIEREARRERGGAAR